jgi:type I restriction enzyme S subunit
MKNGRIDFSDARRISASDFAEWTKKARPQQHDVVLSRRTNPGVTATFGSEVDFALGQNLVLLRADGSHVEPAFLRWLVVGPDWWAEIEKYNNVGAIFDSLKCADVPRFEVPIPPKSAQLRIADVLVSLDDKIDLNRRMNETLEAMAQAIFRDWFVDFGPVRRKLAGATDAVEIMGGLMPDAARAAELAGLFPDALNEDGLPFAWPKRCVTDVATVTGGKQLDKAEIQDFGPNPVFGGGGVMGFSTRSNADDFVITVGRVGAYCGQFFCHRGPAWVNNNASLIRPNAGVSAEWLLLNLRATDIDSIKRGAAQPFVSNGDVGKIELSGSETVASAFAEIVGPFFLAREQRDSENRTLAETRDYLLPRLMSGAVGVGEALEKVEDAA